VALRAVISTRTLGLLLVFVHYSPLSHPLVSHFPPTLRVPLTPVTTLDTHASDFVLPSLLQVNKSLQTLDLGRNNIGDAGAADLAGALTVRVAFLCVFSRFLLISRTFCCCF
jgi:hypothetical protein